MADQFSNLLDEIHEKYPQYEKPAYIFVRAALDYTLHRLKERKELQQPRHISGQELAAGIREFAIDQFGPIAKTVLNSWGVFETLDFGKIVFILIEYKVLGKRDEDRVEDFLNCFEFEQAFEVPFRPSRGIPADLLKVSV
ncbi:MAG: Minf_1886 family protein [Puniceicoccaceae bacterium]